MEAVNKEHCCDAPEYIIRRRAGNKVHNLGEGDVLTTSCSTMMVNSRVSSEADDEDEGEVEGDGGTTTDLLTSSSSRIENCQKGSTVTRCCTATESLNFPEKCFGCGRNLKVPCSCSEAVFRGVTISVNIDKKTFWWSIALVFFFFMIASLRVYKSCFACDERSRTHPSE